MRKSWLLLALLSAVPAQAAPIEMGSQTCQDWLDASEDDQDQMVAWLRGYLAGKSVGTLFDLAGVRMDVTLMRVYCQSHQTTSLVSAAGQWKR